MSLYEGFSLAMKAAGGLDFQRGGVAYEVWSLRNMAAGLAKRPSLRDWVRHLILAQFRAAVAAHGDSPARLLEAMAEPIAEYVGPEYWVHGVDDEVTGYCGDCIDDAVRHFRRHGFPDAERDGGWGTDGGTPSFCEGCHGLMDSTLTDYGVEEELWHAFTAADNPTDCGILCLCVMNGGGEHRKMVRRAALSFFARYPEHRPAAKEGEKVA